jgi:hypothetical protein
MLFLYLIQIVKWKLMGETAQLLIEKQKAESHDTETYQVCFFFFFTTCRKFKFEIGIQQSNFPLCDSFIIWFLYVIKLQFVTNSFFPSTRITTLMFAALSFFILFFSFLPSFPFLTDICIHPVIYQIVFFQRNKN